MVWLDKALHTKVLHIQAVKPELRDQKVVAAVAAVLLSVLTDKTALTAALTTKARAVMVQVLLLQQATLAWAAAVMAVTELVAVAVQAQVTIGPLAVELVAQAVKEQQAVTDSSSFINRGQTWQIVIHIPIQRKNYRTLRM